MAMGRPVLATAVSDLPEILDGCGCVVGPNDPEVLLHNLRRLLEDDGLRTQLSAAARRKAIDEFSYDAMERALEPLLAEVRNAG
jgi:glycosyltransferase involved in cell wall biosynthesis